MTTIARRSVSLPVESMPWEPAEVQDAPPLVCGVCNEVMEDGEPFDCDETTGWHLLCRSCYKRNFF